MPITPPPRPPEHPDRFLDAQEALEAAVLQIIENAVAAGWGEIEALEAAISIAENRMLAIGENDRMLAKIREQFRR
jgi:hypothetical protein